ncbi:hypothetical protein VTN49DRAFT_2526 [Thermomyces lanuginosus]|uniref:uncharacterized protein n=1 Tax=Thermomyces lanuginosus TaxID=5541 RepID=UPI0037436881
MSSYFSSLKTSSAISNLGTRLNSLRRTITSGDESDDPENEDCSHISNVLRAYYAEKGRALPPWLPPDPKNPTPQPRMVVTQASLQQQQQGVPYHQQQQRPPGSRSGSGGGLGDLWGDSGAPSQPPSQTGSLRSRPGNLRQQSSQSLTPSVSSQGRPGIERSTSSTSGTSAQERLRARLQGSSPSPSHHSPSSSGSNQQSQSQSFLGSYRPW